MPRYGVQARLGWLDALRGVAALSVVFEHLSFDTLKPVRHHVIGWFSPGLYGVMVFFLVSGYIVPASLERRGSVRGFWVARVFRLYPMWLAAAAGAIVLSRFRLYSVPANATSHPGTTVLAHAFMLQDLLGVFSIINVLWTLSYEMTFYLLITFLFVADAHRRSARVAVGFAATAFALGGVLPKVALSHRVSDARTVALAASILIIVGLAGAVSGRGRIRTIGAVLAGGTALVLLLFNGRAPAWEGFTILAAMFTGTALYRAEARQITWLKMITTAAAVCGLTVMSGIWHVHKWGMSSQSTLSYQRQWTISILLAGGTFALAMTWRKRRVVRAATWLGTVSYSMYLLHPLVINVYAQLPWLSDTDPLIVQAGLAAGCLALLLGCCWLTYRAVEVPMQRLGRGIAARLDARFGFDVAAVPQPAIARPAIAQPAIAQPAMPSMRDVPAVPARSAGAVRAGVALTRPDRQRVPSGERVQQARRDRQRGEPGGSDPAHVGGIIARGEFSAGDGAFVVVDVEDRSVQPRPDDRSKKCARRDP